MTGSAPQKFHPVVWIAYYPRLAAHLFGTLMLGTVFWGEGYGMLFWSLIFADALVWPNLALLISSRVKEPKKFEYLGLQIDHLIAGCWAAFAGFEIWVTATLMLMAVTGSMSIAGVKGYARGMFFSAVGALATTLYFGFDLRAETKPATIAVALVALAIFTGVIAYFTYSRGAEIQSMKKKLRSSNDLLEKMKEVTQLASSSLELRDMLTNVFPTLQALFACDAVFIIRREKGSTGMYIAEIAGAGIDESNRGRLVGSAGGFGASQPFLRRLFAHPERLYLPDLTRARLSAAESQLVQIIQPKEGLVVPILNGRHVSGLMFVMTRSAFKSPSGDGVEALFQMVEHISLMANNALLYAASREQAEEIEHKNENLLAANEEIQRQRDEVISTNARLEQTLETLQNTQKQLVQQEKLASLGHLTAGIAHEIKNPLNFVNNFSAVSVELIQEMSDVVAGLQEKSSRGEPLPAADFEDLSDLAADLTTNLEKVQKHGERADKIVRSMLQHAREGSAEKAPTDVNALISEYANLSFHGMRAGAKAINCEMVYDLDPALGSLPVVPQDFSRIFVNIINNAFDALWEKIQNLPEPERAAFRPVVKVATRRTGATCRFDITDNGPGIPEAIRDKILQPFFTTKQGTEGTGLGLSITNDIILAHNGTLAIATGSGGTTFTITIPGAA